MSSIVLNGPVVPTDTHNEVLRLALFHSPIERFPSVTDYHLIEIGIREGEFTTWIGEWDQSGQKVEGATPTSILNEGRSGMRLKAGQAVVVKVTTTGTPDSLRGSRVTFTLGLVGGRDGTAKPLVSASALSDIGNRPAIAALEKQINTGGLADWDDPVDLVDPAGGEAYTDYETAQTITAAAATSDGLASVDVTVPDGETRLVIVTASASYLGSGGTSLLNIYIGDGTTDHAAMPASATATVKGTPTTNYATQISETTTFTVRFDCATSDALIQAQAISVISIR